jgi:hypothetical protein
MSKSTKPFPDWEDVLSSACRLQEILPGTVLVGETAAAVHIKHRISHDEDHVLTDLRENFDNVLGQLETAAGLPSARITEPVLILGNLDGIETCVRQLIRTEPWRRSTSTAAGRNLPCRLIGKFFG